VHLYGLVVKYLLKAVILRLQETSAPQGGIQLSPTAANALRDPPPGHPSFVIVERGEMVIKSKGVMTTYLLKGRASESGIRSFASPLERRDSLTIVASRRARRAGPTVGRRRWREGSPLGIAGLNLPSFTTLFPVPKIGGPRRANQGASRTPVPSTSPQASLSSSPGTPRSPLSATPYRALRSRAAPRRPRSN